MSMTVDEKKKVLKSYRLLEDEKEHFLDQLLYWKNKAEKVGSSIITPKHGGIGNQLDGMGNQLERAIDKYMEAEQKYYQRVVEVDTILNDIESSIDELEDDTLRVLMRHRYIEGHTWEQVAVNMSYSWQHVHKLHSLALQVIKLR